MKIYEYAIIYLPKDDEKNKASILVEPKPILAIDQNKAAMIAARAIPEEYLDRLDEIEVAVRPF